MGGIYEIQLSPYAEEFGMTLPDDLDHEKLAEAAVPGELQIQAATGNSNKPRQCFPHR